MITAITPAPPVWEDDHPLLDFARGIVFLAWGLASLLFLGFILMLGMLTSEDSPSSIER